LYSRRRFLLAGSSLVSAASLSLGRQEPTFSTNVKVVSVLANVKNRKGQIIRNLTKDDFTILEDGRPQVIRYFTQQSDLPLLLGLMIDTSMSQERVLDAERSACFRFLDQVLRPRQDQVFIMQFDLNVLLRQDLTSSWRDLNETLSSVNTPSRNQLKGQLGGGTLLYDAIVDGSKIMHDQHGRKALIVMSDGVDTGSNDDLSTAIDTAQKADTLIYSILFSDEGFYGLGFGSAAGKNVLARMSRETGGGFFQVSKKESIDQIFDRIQDELRSQYSLGYVSDVPVRVPEFRRIQVKANQSGLVVQARERYWAER
jgi:VWFA-related protein